MNTINPPQRLEVPPLRAAVSTPDASSLAGGKAGGQSHGDALGAFPDDIETHALWCNGHCCRRTDDPAGELVASMLGAAIFLALVTPILGLVANN